MRVYNDLRDVNLQTIGKPIAVALGNFDGVHMGHRQLLRSLRDFASAHGAEPVVFTFYPHPLMVLRPEHGPKLILSVEEKLEHLARLGIKTVILAPFDLELANMTAMEFVSRVLVDKLQVKGVFVGYNYTFGEGGQGTPELLAQLADQYGYYLHVTPPVEVAGEVVSSTLIRSNLAQGQIDFATRLLGYHPYVQGEVIHGEKRGRTIGFPTANLELFYQRIYPTSGVYAVQVHYQGVCYPGVANLGVKPTFHQQNVPNLEVHLLNFAGDLYGQQIKVDFLEKIRGEQAFQSVEQLIEQIKLDVSKARAIIDNVENNRNLHNWLIS